ncbi:MAG TPA: hypothetical protein VGM37_10500 [Armatimonadota bacterium]|jgi:predicted RecA/RadA family phage recombinase
MADIPVTPAAVAPAKSLFESYTFIAGEALKKGKAVYIKADGKVWRADASAAGTAGSIGVCLSDVSAGQAVEVLVHGLVAGFDLSALAYGATVYLSDSDSGILADAAGTTSRKMGVVWPTSDLDRTKVLLVCPAIV